MSKYTVRGCWCFCVERVIEADSKDDAEDNFYNAVELTQEEIDNGEWFDRPYIEEIGDEK